MTWLDNIKENKKNPGIKFLIILLIFVLYLVFSYFWSVKSDVYAFDFLPRETVFYYEWPDKEFFDLKTKQQLDLLDLSVPNEHITNLKALFGDKFSDVEEIVWFQTTKDGDDYYLLRFRSLSDKYVEDLQGTQNNKRFRKAADNILFVYQNQDLVLPELVDGRFSINHIKKGNNIYWQIDKQPEFLIKTSNSIKSFLSYQDVYLNIQNNKLNLFQLYNDGSEIEDKFSNVFIPQDFDLLLGLRASSTEAIVNYIGNQIIIANFQNLPYFNLTQEKFNDYFLRDSLLWQKDDNWILVKEDDWWPLITDLASTLQLEEKNAVLPDGTAYIEYVVKEKQTTQHFNYMGYDLWEIDGILGTNINKSFYISNNRQALESLISQQSNIKALSATCAPADNYNILDILWWDNNKLKNKDLKDYLLSKDFPDLKVYSYQNSIIQGITWCF